MKKWIAFALVMVLALSLVAGCSGGGSNSSGSSNTPSNNSSNSENNSNTPPASDSGSSSTPASTTSSKIEYDEVIWDGEGMKVTLTGFGKYLGDWCYNFTLENNTDKTITADFSSRVSVNGCMIESLAANSDRTNIVNAGETTDDTILRFGPDYLEKRGITTISDFELTIFFYDSDNQLDGPLFMSDPIALPTPDGPGASQTFDVDGLVVFDEAGIKVTVIRQDYDINGGFNDGVWVFVENNSGMDLEVGSGSGGMECMVANGKAISMK